jgi:hypothetical protein
MLGLAKRVNAKILQASTSEVYGDPLVHTTRILWGHVNPIGERAVMMKENVQQKLFQQNRTMLKLKLSEYSIHTDQKCIQTMGA